MKLKITEETIEKDRLDEQNLLYQRYMLLRSQAKQYRIYYADQITALDVHYETMKSDIKKNIILLMASIILGCICMKMGITDNMTGTILESIFRPASAVFFTIAVCSTCKLLMRMLIYAVMTESQGFRDYIEKHEIVTMEEEKRHCRNRISEIDRMLSVEKGREDVIQQDVDLLTGLSRYDERRASKILFPLERSELATLAVITILFLIIYILI